MGWRNIRGEDAKKEEILNHYTRGQIYGYIIAQVIPHYNQIKRGLDLTNGTTAYHLRILEKHGIVKSVKKGHKKHFYVGKLPEGFMDENTSDREAEILDMLTAEAEITMLDIKDRMGVSGSTVTYHIKKLLDRKKVKTRRRGMYMMVSLS